MLRPGHLTCLALVPALPKRLCSLTKMVTVFNPLMRVSQWPTHGAPDLTEMLSYPKAPVVRALASGKSQELTQTVPFWEKVLAKMVAKQLQGIYLQ